MVRVLLYNQHNTYSRLKMFLNNILRNQMDFLVKLIIFILKLVITVRKQKVKIWLKKKPASHIYSHIFESWNN